MLIKDSGSPTTGGGRPHVTVGGISEEFGNLTKGGPPPVLSLPEEFDFLRSLERGDGSVEPSAPEVVKQIKEYLGDFPQDPKIGFLLPT